MEPDVIRLYSSSPPPMEDGAEEEDDEFGDFGGFSGVPNSVSFTEFDTPASFSQNQALTATSPPELLNNGGVVGISNLSSGPTSRGPAAADVARSNGVAPAGDGGPSDRTVNAEELRKHADRRSNSPDFSGSGAQTQEDQPADCNGGGDGEVLTNGFVTFEVQGAPASPSPSPSSSRNSVHPHQTGATTDRPPSPQDDFADFTAFSNAEVQGRLGQATNASGDLDDSEGSNWLAEEEGTCQQHSNIEQGSDSEDDVRNAAAHVTGSDVPGSDSTSRSAAAPDGLSNGDGSFHTDGNSADLEQRDVAVAHDERSSSATGAVCTEEPASRNGTDSEGSEEGGVVGGVSLNAGADGEEERADEKGSGNETETETETETSLGRPLSTDALEEYGDASTTGSVPSPPLQEETATPADHSQLAEDDDDDDGDFGDFGDAGSFGGQGFTDFEQPEIQEQGSLTDCTATPAQEPVDDEEFGDFDAPESRGGGGETEDGEEFADFPGSDSFADFSSAPVGADAAADGGWNAFDEPGQGDGEADSWAAFGEEQSAAPPEKSEEDEWQEGGTAADPPSASDDASRRDSLSASLSSRLEKLFQATFPETPVPQLGEPVLSLKTLLEPPERPRRGEDGTGADPDNGGLRDVWSQLQDIHDAFGLRHQWGGSHSNKTLLCSLGIDTRNILFTGQKKQPVIVPMYAASLGMLEPTKEPVKPVSAAEMIASIAQAPPVALEISTCPQDTAQETLPPVQFDWSSSGLTNPLDASGGSSLLNLDFFGPVEDSGSCSSTSIPGVDPELYELTTAKLDPTGSGSRVADAFARLMSTMEKTSTSTRKPRKEENLSEEAAKVIAGLPDLSFMQAKVLMFPTTLTPLGCSEPTPD